MKLKKEILSVKPRILHLQESNDIYMELTMCIFTNQTNLNNLKFTDDYIQGIIDNKDHFIGIPLVANRSKLESGLYNSLTHELNKKTGLLETDSIGSYVDFWSDSDEDGTLKLMGNVRIPKRYPSVCNALIELYEAGDLEFSCEIFAYGYAEINEETKERSINYKYDGRINSLFASCVVSNPAEPKSKADLLVAEALEKDLKGGEKVQEPINPTLETFNKGMEIKYHVEIETSSIKWSEISSQIYNILNPIDLKSNYRKYNFYIRDLYNDYVLVEEYDDYNTLWKIGYEIINDSVVIVEKDKWIKGTLGFIPDGVAISTLLAENETLSATHNTKINELNNQHKEEKQVTEEQIKELQDKVEAMESKVSELEGTIVAQQEAIQTHVTKEAELSNEIEVLVPFKEKYETAEKEAKKTVLVEKFGKLLSEEIMKSEAVVNAVEALDEMSLNAVVVEQVSKELSSRQVDGKANETVVVVASKQEDLISESVLQKYGIN